MSRIRMVFAAVFAPGAAPLLYFFATLMWSGYIQSNSAHLEKLIYEVVFALMPVSYLMSIAFGIPLIYLLSRLNRLNLRWCLLIAGSLGAVMGLLLTFIFTGPQGTSESAAERLAVSGLGAAAALIIAFTFSLIAGIPASNKDVT